MVLLRLVLAAVASGAAVFDGTMGVLFFKIERG